jgi:hypothetical protein
MQWRLEWNDAVYRSATARGANDRTYRRTAGTFAGIVYDRVTRYANRPCRS